MVLVGLALSGVAHAQGAPDGKPGEKKVSIDHLRKQYWNQGGELEVVQNRVYSKSQRFELSVGGGFINSDPFLSTKSANLGVGYYFNEMIGVRVLAWKIWAPLSQAGVEVPQISGVEASVNRPEIFLGAEATVNAVYGKLALFGSSILYYDLMMAAGIGQMRTETGNYIAPSVGLTQNVYINQWLGLRLDYRMLMYNETVIRKDTGVPRDRTNWSNTLVIGTNFLF